MSEPAIRIEIHIDPQIIKAIAAAVGDMAVTAQVIERFTEKLADPPRAQPAPDPAPDPTPPAAARPEPPPPVPHPVEPPPVSPSTSPTKLNGHPPPASFQPGDMVRLNNPEPPLRVHSGKPDEAHTELQRNEVGQITRILPDGNCAVRWNRAPGFEVALKPEWLLPDNEVRFAEPYEQQTAAAYADYVRRWLAVAVNNQWTKEQVNDRWNREASEIRTRLGESFAGPDWDDLSAEMRATVKKLATP